MAPRVANRATWTVVAVVSSLLFDCVTPSVKPAPRASWTGFLTARLASANREVRMFSYCMQIGHGQFCRSLRYAMLQEFILSAKLSRQRGCVRRYRYTDPGNGKSNSWTRQPRFLSFWQRAAVSLSTVFSVAALSPAHALQLSVRYLALKKHYS